MTRSADAPAGSRSLPAWQVLAAGVLRLVLGALRWMPARLAYLLADLAALALLLSTLRHERKVAGKGRGLFRNLRIVFRDRWSPGLARRLVVSWARHMCWLLVDFARMPRLQRHNLERHVELDEFRVAHAVEREGNGLICITGHAGLWELSGHLAALQGVPIVSVGRPIPVPPIQELVDEVRTSGGQVVHGKWGVLRELRRELREGKALGLVLDENVSTSPVFVPFLGTLAASSRVAGFLQLASRAPIVVVTCNRLGRERYRFHLWRVIRPERSGDREGDLRRIAGEVAAGLSEAVLAYPEQWFWGSRRFRTRPEGEEQDPDGLPPAFEPLDEEAFAPGWRHLLARPRGSRGSSQPTD